MVAKMNNAFASVAILVTIGLLSVNSGPIKHAIDPLAAEDVIYQSTHIKRSVDPLPEKHAGTEVTPNTSHHGGEQENGTRSAGSHHSIHVASWHFHYVKSPFIIAVFLLTAGIAKLGFHKANFLSSKVPESCLLIILGVGVGAIFYRFLPVNGDDKFGMTSELFFLYLLPPIILESAYSLHDRTFYDNVGTVLIYAVLGTVLNCFLIGPSLYGLYKWGLLGDGMPDVNLIQCLVFSAIIVAVDPVAVLAIFQEVGVNNTLYFLVFGESLLNDAVTVVLYNMMKTLNLMEHITADQIILGILQFFVVSLGGLAIGMIFGALTAILTKYTEHCRVVEPLAVFVLAYISYLMAEMFHFSGIISIIGCGLTQAQYAFHNISKKSYTTVKYFSKMMSATNDCVIFMFLGISIFNADVLDRHNWHAGFILWTLLLCLLYRFLGVFLLTFFLNRGNRIRRIGIEEQFIMAYGGLRGAVAFSLVDVLVSGNLPKGHFLTTTLIVILFTVFIQGSTIKPLVKLLRVKMEQNEKLLLSEEINSHVTDHVMAGIEEILGEKGEHYVREYLEHYNRRFLKCWLQRDPVSNDEQIMKYFQQLALEQHFENLQGSKMIMEKYGSEQQLISEDILTDEDEDRGSDDDGSACFILPMSSLNASSEDINSELDNELLRQRTGIDMRRKSMFPVNLTKDMETKLTDNPTAVDIRKIMAPSRRQMQYKRLDKNLKTEDSENDLLRYLQNKQIKTRRMSQAVWNQPIIELPESNDVRMRNTRRKSLAPAAVTDNYVRRLSLAVPSLTPTAARRKRGVSVGNVLKSLDSPARSRLRLRRWNTSKSSESIPEETKPTGLPPVKEQNAKVDFALEEEDEEEEEESNDARVSLHMIAEQSEEESTTKHKDKEAKPQSASPSSPDGRRSLRQKRLVRSSSDRSRGSSSEGIFQMHDPESPLLQCENQSEETTHV